ncbi:MAG TPA: formyltransferase [Candidatus Binataceae bacterium]|nr:formyltransferase [Candidatus Binataceae bacterium]
MAPDARQSAAVKEAACVLFAYQDMGYACMEALLSMGAPVAAVFSHRDDPHEEIWWRSCTELAERHRVPVHYPDKMDDGWIAHIAAMKPAVIYSFFYRNLLPQNLLDCAPLGAYNVHGALLPRYRGRASVNWVLVNGEKETGVTLHHMVARADAGDIVAQRSVEIEDRDTARTLYRKLVPLGAELIREFHPLIAAGCAPRRPQDISAGSYFGRRRPEDGRIDWRWPARRIFNLVRAVTHPYPGAFCVLGEERKLLVWQTQIAAETERRGDPGEIIGEAAGGALEVAAGEGSILLLRAQCEGGVEGEARNVMAANLLKGSISLR